MVEEGFSLDQAVLKGRPLPEWYMEEPPTTEGDEFYLRAFNELATTRQVGLGFGPIPWDKMLAYAQVHGLEQDVTELFIYVVREMDNAFLEYEAERQKSRSADKTGGETNAPGRKVVRR